MGRNCPLTSSVKRVYAFNASRMAAFGDVCCNPFSTWSAGVCSGAETVDRYPWVRTIEAGVSQTGLMLGLEARNSEQSTFLVNTSPFIGTDGQRRGVLA